MLAKVMPKWHAEKKLGAGFMFPFTGTESPNRVSDGNPYDGQRSNFFQAHKPMQYVRKHNDWGKQLPVSATWQTDEYWLPLELRGVDLSLPWVRKELQWRSKALGQFGAYPKAVGSPSSSAPDNVLPMCLAPKSVAKPKAKTKDNKRLRRTLLLQQYRFRIPVDTDGALKDSGAVDKLGPNVSLVSLPPRRC